jgi:hypothetical protein
VLGECVELGFSRRSRSAAAFHALMVRSGATLGAGATDNAFVLALDGRRRARGRAHRCRHHLPSGAPKPAASASR